MRMTTVLAAACLKTCSAEENFLLMHYPFFKREGERVSEGWPLCGKLGLYGCSSSPLNRFNLYCMLMRERERERGREKWLDLTYYAMPPQCTRLA